MNRFNFIYSKVTRLYTGNGQTECGKYKLGLDPYQNNHIDKVERVQSKAIRFVLNQYDPLANVTQMRHQLKWPTLQTCRFTSRMVMFYKVVYQHIALPLPDHEHQYTTVPTRTDVFKFSYFPRTVRCWSILPTALVLKQSAEAFKNSLQATLDDGLVYLVPPRGIYDKPCLGITVQQTGAVF